MNKSKMGTNGSRSSVTLVGLLACCLLAGCGTGVGTAIGQDQGRPTSSTGVDATDMRNATYAVVVGFRVGPIPEEVAYFPIGTAFGVRPRLLVTNAHVVDAVANACAPIEEVLGVQHGTGTVVKLLRAVAHPDYRGNPLGSPDVGLLTSRDELPSTLKLASEAITGSLDVGQFVVSAGFPGDVNDIFPILPNETVPQASQVSGTISSLRSFDPTVVVTPENTDVLQYQFASFPGTSGSPVLLDDLVVAVHNAGTVTLSIVGEDADGPILGRIPAQESSFGIHVRHLHELIELFDESVLQGLELPPDSTRCPCGTECDWCWFNTDFEGQCPIEWINDAECDCGCQFSDPDCSMSEASDPEPSDPPAAPTNPATPPSQPSSPPEPPTQPTNPGQPEDNGTRWITFVNPDSGTECGIINGYDFQAVVLPDSRRLLYVHSVDGLAGSATIDQAGNLLIDGNLSGAFIAFDFDRLGNERLWMFGPDDNLAWLSASPARYSPDDVAAPGCDPCSRVDQPAHGWCP